jgi:phosphohistidine phosphatase SixA
VLSARWSTTTRVLLSHARAGSVDVLRPLDDFRPLTPVGWSQAEEAVEGLRDLDLRCLLSSPSLRCRQTLMPLAVALEIDIEPMPQLSRTAHPDALLELLRSDSVHGSVLCTHPHLIARVLRLLGQAADVVVSPGSAGVRQWRLEDSTPIAAETPPIAAGR